MHNLNNTNLLYCNSIDNVMVLNGPYDYELNCFQDLPTIIKVVLVVLSREPPAERHCGSGSCCSFSRPNSLCLHVYNTVQEFYKSGMLHYDVYVI